MGLVSLAGSGVLAAELFNTAVEHLGSLASRDSSRYSRRKDCASGAVLIAVLGAISVGVALIVHFVLTK